MATTDNEDERLRSAALQNAQSILRARQGAEESLRKQSEWLKVTLASIGDAVISTDAEGRVSFMNGVAERMTGWPQAEALGRPLPDVFHIINEQSRQPVENPALRALRDGVIVGLANHTILVAKDGTELPIDDSAAPIRSAEGQILGCVLVFRDITDRHSSDRALHASEERLRLATSAAELGIWVWHLADDRVTWENDQPYEIFGLPRTAEPINGVRLRDEFVHPEDLASFNAAVATAMSSEEGLYFLGRIHRLDGALRWVEFTGRLQRDDDGIPVRIVGTAADVTKRQAAEGQVRQTAVANAKFRALFDQAAQFAGILSVDGTVIEANRLCLDGCGYTRAEIIGKPFWECGWWNRSPAAMQLIKAACAEAAGGKLFQAETTYFVADGTERQVHLVIAPVTDEAGRILYIAPTGTDITERKLAQEALRRSQSDTERQRRVYEAILTNTPDFAYVFDLNHCVIYANEVLLKMWGRTWEETKGQGFLKLGYETWHAEMHEREIDQVVATRQPIRGVVPFSGTFGRRIYDYIFVPVFGENGEVEAVAGTTRDVTERQQSEDDLRRLAAELSEADHRKNEFLAMLAHELRNPLAPIRNAVQIFRAKGTPVPEMQWLTDVIDRQTDQLTRLVDDLLDVSRITRGNIELRKERVVLSSVLNNALEASQPLIDSRGHNLTVNVPPEPIPLEVDPTRLAQVLSNLLNNAAKYMDRGGCIWLTARREGDQAVIRVKDTGVGIPPEMLSRVFDMFTQVDHSLERSQGGLGIGLTLVQRLVELHGGTVEALSEGAGKGSEFVVRLPRAPADEPADRPTSSIDGSGTLLSRRRILVVDDNRDAANSLAMLLRLLGNEVLTAYDGLEAVEVAEASQFDLILLDIGMPKLNGYEAARRIRETQGDRVVLIALTGWGQEDDRRRSKEAGFDFHLTKPVEISALQTLLAEPQFRASPPAT